MSKVPLIKPSRANRPRNAFDLSQRHLFTAPAGALLPILTMDLMPHDHVEISATDFMRTLPMNSAAFMSMRGVYEFYFVPYKQLFTYFDQFITGMTDYRTSHLQGLKSKVLQYLPYMEIKELVEGFKSLQTTDIFGFEKKKNAFRLMDLLGYGKYSSSAGEAYTDAVISNGGLGSVSPLRALAYQKIYADYYRNSTYEQFDMAKFNIDFFISNSNPRKVAFSEVNAYGWFDLQYRNANLDVFTNVRPTPLFSIENFNPKFFLGNNSYELSGANVTTLGDNARAQENASVTIKMGAYKTPELASKPETYSVNLSVDDIRNAFALDKLASITMRAGKTYKEQMRAHFGIEVDEGRDGNCIYIGGFDSNLQVGDVVQTAGTSVTGKDAKLGGYLGRTTGKAVGNGYGEIKFDAKEHGILMCIYSLVPAVQYDSTRIDPFVQKLERGDFFVPEFENLGMQPLYAKNINWRYPPVAIKGTNPQKWIPQALGWQPRYSEYKTALDLNHGQFAKGEPLSYWSVARSRDAGLGSKFDISSLKINPKWLDDVFAVNYNGSELTDQVFGSCFFDIMKVSDMSTDGMPHV